MTNDEIKAALAHLTDKLNRIEATLMLTRTVRADMKQPIAQAIEILDAATEQLRSRLPNAK